MARTADDLYIEMLATVDAHEHIRCCKDPASPQRDTTREAAPGRTFTLESVDCNVTTVRPINAPWAVANVLHFFAGSEDADALTQYSAEARRFLTEESGKLFFRGAYGPMFLPGLWVCVERLRDHRSSRRAIVTCQDIRTGECMNSPACISSMQLIVGRYGLNLVVFQRSLHLRRVMPYDTVLLTSILRWAAGMTGVPAAHLVWCIGSLHTGVDDPPLERRRTPAPRLLIPWELLNSAPACAEALKDTNRVSELTGGV